MFRSCLAAALFCLPMSAHAQGATNTVPITSEFQLLEMNWSHGGGKLFVAWNVYDVGGRLAVCGAVRHSSSAVSRQNNQILGKGWVKHGNRKIINGLQFFANMGFAPGFNDGHAKCQLTNLATSAAAGGLRIGIDPGRDRF